MTQFTTLVVTNDDTIMTSIEEAVFSVGDQFEWATNQYDARRLLRTCGFSYYILDVNIPARPHGRADKEFGANLLLEIRRLNKDRDFPVVLIGTSDDCLAVAEQLCEVGEFELFSSVFQNFVPKPLPRSGRTLASAIRKIRRGCSVPSTTRPQPPAPAAVNRLGRFHGGELTFCTDRHGSGWVELCGIRIISDKNGGQSIRLLRSLSQTDSAGRYVRLSAEELMDIIGAMSVGTITGCVQTIRNNVIVRLAKHLGCECHTDDLIAHDEQGYYLRDWIDVREKVVQENEDHFREDNVPAGTTMNVSDVPAGSFDGVPRGSTVVPANVPVGSIELANRWNNRQQWVISELKQGTEVQRFMIQEEFGVGEKTAKRDLAELTRAGVIEYVRAARGGYYRLRS